MTTTPEAFLLITLENTTLRTAHTIQTGVLGLECVTVPVHGQRDVYLVLRLNDVEIPVEHDRVISLDTSSPRTRTYTLHPTDADPNTVTLDVHTNWHPSLLEDIETFDGILSQYTQFNFTTEETPIPAYVSQVGEKSKSLGDFKGHLVLVNEDNGEVVGEFDKKIHVQEDPNLRERGHEQDPVIIEVPDGKVRGGDDEHPLEFFARAIPPEERDWMTTSATTVSHAITFGTNLFISVLNGASQLYINHSSPSPHHPDNANATGEPPKPPPRALVFLTSDRTRQNLSTAHAYTGQAVKISGQTVSRIHDIIKKTMGSDKKGKGKAAVSPAAAYAPQPSYPQQGYQEKEKNGYSSTPPSLPPNKPISRSSSPTPSYKTYAAPGAPPAYEASSSGHLRPDGKPSLPPRSQPSSRGPSPAPALPPRKPLSTVKRVILSADLILSTLDVSTKRVLDAGASRVGAVMGHKYGEAAGHNSEMLVGSARNVALVYVDMRGFGRKAILKTAGKEFVKGRFHSSKQ